MYGASNSVQRSELVVSGRIAAIEPVPLAATDFSFVSALKLLFSCDSEIEAAWALRHSGDTGAGGTPDGYNYSCHERCARN